MLYSEQAIMNLFSWLQCKRKCTILAREDNIYKMNLLFHMLVIYANDSLRAGYYQLSLMSTVLSVSYAH